METFFILLVMGLILVSGIANSIECAERKRNFHAGTHDYYGNKL